MQITEQTTSLQVSQTIVLLLTCLLIGWCALRRRPNHLIKKQLLKANIIPSNKIIIAIEPVGLFFDYSQRWKTSYTELCLPCNFIIKVIKNCLGIGHYFKQKFPHRAIRQFLRSLKSIHNIQLFLCTNLKEDIGQKMVHHYMLESYFPFKKYKEGHEQISKHAIDVDSNTRRVIILTANHQDLSDQNEKYFWILKIKPEENCLKDISNALRELVQNNKDVDYLHQELAQRIVDNYCY